LREIVIVRVAHLNRTTYVFKQHVPQLSAPEGLTDEECAALADWQKSKFFDTRERATLAYTDAMTAISPCRTMCSRHSSRISASRRIVELKRADRAL